MNKMFKNNKKQKLTKLGFTLIELLAVIIILAVVALIATPIILDVINDARRSSAESEANIVLSGLRNYCQEEELNIKLNPSIERLCNDGLTEEEIKKIITNLDKDTIIKNAVYENGEITSLEVTSNNIEFILTSSGNMFNTSCMYDGDLTQGAEFIDGQYTYRYMQEATSNGDWTNISQDGWGVMLTNKESTDAVTTPVCTTINNKPIVSMKSMFYNSKATSIDLSIINTSNVTNMAAMFYAAKTKNLDLSKFNTSNVTNMSFMFANSLAKSLILDVFDTSKVTTMAGMFWASQATTLDLSSFDTSNIIYMQDMLRGSKATTLDLSSFDLTKVINMERMFQAASATTGYSRIKADAVKYNNSDVTAIPTSLVFVAKSKNCIYGGDLVQGAEFIDGQYTYRYNQHANSTGWSDNTYDGWGVILTDKESTDAVTTHLCTTINDKPIVAMSYMFNNSKASSIDVSSFDTSAVKTMTYMFAYTEATSIDVSNFDTNNVTNMAAMFFNSKFTSLDLSSFDTSNVTSIYSMFNTSRATKIIGLNKFDTRKITSMGRMFSASHATELDLSSFDTSNVTNMDYMFQFSRAETLDLSSFDITNVTSMTGMFKGAKSTTGYARTTDEAARYNDAEVTLIQDTLVFTTK